MDKKKEKYFSGFYNQLLGGINYYREIVLPCNDFSEKDVKDFNHHLDKAELELEAMFKRDQRWQDTIQNSAATLMDLSCPF
jgi:hypothetical protein